MSRIVRFFFAFCIGLLTITAIQTPQANAAQAKTNPGASAPLTYTQQRQMEDLRFRHDIGQSILEKMLIAGLILLLTLWTSQRLERFKAREAYISAFTQDHVNRVASIWQLIYRWEAYIEDMSTLLEIEKDNAAKERSVAKSRTFASELRSAVRKERYWLGADLYSRFVSYHNGLHRYLDMVLVEDADTALGAKLDLDNLKQDIMVTLDSDLAPSPASKGLE